jgi:predicted dienelactone hydrolase
MLRIGIFGALWMVLSGCQSTEPEDTAVVEERPLDEVGPFNVGTRRESFLSKDGYDIPLQIWYPTADAEGSEVFYDSVFPGESWDLASPDCSSARPVLMFSHGNTGIRWQSAFLMHWLAGHGFVVAAPDHVTNTFADQDGSKFGEHVLRRPVDIIESFDWLVDASVSGGTMDGCIVEEDGYAVMGHSFGGYTSFVVSGATLQLNDVEALCDYGYAYACDFKDTWVAENPDSKQVNLGDDRVWATGALAPWDAGGVLNQGMEALTNPSLVLTGVQDTTTPLSMVSGLVDAVGEDNVVHYGKLAETGHFSFSPVACQLLSGDGCGDAYLDLEEVKALTNVSTLGFLAVELEWPGASDYFPVQSEYLSWE